MLTSINRRQWLKRAGTAAAAGLSLGPEALSAAPALAITHPRTPGGFVRLSHNENPYGPSASAKEAVIGMLGEGSRYPSNAARELVQLIAEKEGVSEKHIILGAGSTEVLDMAGIAFGASGAETVSADPSYQGLTKYAETVGGEVVYVPLDEGMAHNLPAMERRMTNNTRIVYVCNPNNPTGTIVQAATLRGFIEEVSRRSIVFVDEAYLELMADPAERQSMVSLVREDHNVVVARTFSKIHGLAGLRIGYGVARPDLVDRMAKYQMGGVNQPGVAAAIASLKDTEFQLFSQQKVAEARRFTYGVLGGLGYKYVPSHTNFVFFDTRQPIQMFSAAMRERGVLVARPFPPYTSWCRVSMGTEGDMQAFAGAIEHVAASGIR